MNPVNTPITLSPLGTPVKTSRLWTDALVPRAGDGWNWIGQFYNYRDALPTEWVVINLEGVVAPQHYFDDPYTVGDRGHYANENFGISNQLRAANGRIFFPAYSGWWWYYDPATEKVKSGRSVPGTDSLLYTMEFNNDGKILYGGTLGTSKDLPEVLMIDTDTLVVTRLCQVGSANHTQNAYAYNLRADGDWLYVLVGEDFWEVVAVDLKTNTQKILKTAPVNATATFWPEDGGWTVKLHKSGQTIDQGWVVDGNWYSYHAGEPLPFFPPRDTTRYKNPITGAPDIDESFCPGVLKWKPHKSTGPWTENQFSITNKGPIKIESLLLLPDGSILGDVEQYQGFFRFDPVLRTTKYFGAFPGVTEGRSRLVVDGKAYISGYPNAPLWEYDPNTPWVTTGLEDTWNPKYLKRYWDGISPPDVKRSMILAYSSASNRLYMAGLRERSGRGAGIGYYDFAHKQFAGLNTGLNFYVGGLGLVVFNKLKRVVFGGTIGDDPAFPGQTPTVAQLILYDLDLKEIERQTPVPGLLGTGALFRGGDPWTVVGLPRASKLIYLWDVVSRKLVKSVTISAPIGAAIQGPGGTITAVIGSRLVQINPLTLVITSLGTLANPAITSMVQRDHALYVSIGAELYKIQAAPA